jgi:hypothetical protein
MDIRASLIVDREIRCRRERLNTKEKLLITQTIREPLVLQDASFVGTTPSATDSIPWFREGSAVIGAWITDDPRQSATAPVTFPH